MKAPAQHGWGGGGGPVPEGMLDSSWGRPVTLPHCQVSPAETPLKLTRDQRPEEFSSCFCILTGGWIFAVQSFRGLGVSPS